MTDNSGALGINPTGIIAGTYKGTEYDETGRAISSSGKVKATEIEHSSRLTDTGADNAILDLTPTGITEGIYKGLTLDKWGRVTGTNNLVRGDEISINNSLISTEGVLGVSKAPDSDRLGGQLPSYYLPATGKSADSDKLDGVDITAFKGLDSLTDPNADRVLFWDDSAGALKWLTLGTGLTITDTTIKPSQPQFYPLTTALISTSWNGNSFSTTSKTLIDLSSVFGVPAGVKAVYVQMAIRDSASSTTDAWIVLGADNTAGKGINFGCGGLANDMWARPAAIVPCNTDGDIYYQINASGTSTFDVYLFICGYWL